MAGAGLRRIFLPLLVATPFLLMPSSAAALVDTPQHLMVKGLETNALLMGGRWRAHCTSWHLEGQTFASTRCWRLHKRVGQGYRSTFYDGTGEVLLKQEYHSIYWSFRYRIKVFERGCTPEVIEEEGEPPWVIGCTSVEKRDWSPWRLIFLH